MRHNFLPPQEQAIFKRGYRVRLIIVSLFLFSVVGLVGVGSLFPAYIYVYTEKQADVTTAALLKKNQDTAGVVRIQNELQADAHKIQTLSSAPIGTIPSDIIERIIVARGSVHITSITLNSVSTTTAVVTLDGVAPTRESLVVFKTRLEGLSIGNKVELPISGFAKSKDISFSLKVTHILP